MAPSGNAPDFNFADFTERGYRTALGAAQARYRFESFGTRSTKPHVLWRHDVDYSVHRAARIARLEADAGATATYFLLLHSPFYNLLERPVTELARSIASCGHRIGLHFDSAFYPDLQGMDDLAELLLHEAALLERVLEVPVEAFSFHNPGLVHDDLAFDADKIAGLVNAYGRTLRAQYGYVSDSNGYWRFRRLFDVRREGEGERLHVLTHPVWWQAEPMAPRERIARSVTGRAERTLRDYDDLLARAARRNIG